MHYAINSKLFDNQQLSVFSELLLAKHFWNEHELLKMAYQKLQLELPNFNDALSLFQSHFILFNALYRLIGNKNFPYAISIEVTRITLIEPTEANDNSTTDPALSAYYLDEENLIITSRSMIQSMLENFGQEFGDYLQSQGNLENNNPTAGTQAAQDQNTPANLSVKKIGDKHKRAAP